MFYEFIDENIIENLDLKYFRESQLESVFYGLQKLHSYLIPNNIRSDYQLSLFTLISLLF